jgi:hypothetical protein
MSRKYKLNAMFGALDFDVEIGIVLCEAQLWNFCTNSELAVGPRGTKEDVDLVGWSLGPVDAY